MIDINPISFFWFLDPQILALGETASYTDSELRAYSVSLRTLFPHCKVLPPWVLNCLQKTIPLLYYISCSRDMVRQRIPWPWTYCCTLFSIRFILWLEMVLWKIPWWSLKHSVSPQMVVLAEALQEEKASPLSVSISVRTKHCSFHDGCNPV